MNVKAGEYLLAVNGRDLKPPANLYSLFENTSGKIVEITVGPNPDGTGSRTVQVVPIANELRCAIATGSKAICGRSTRRPAAGSRTSTCRTPAAPGYTYFKRYFYPQVEQGGHHRRRALQRRRQVADYYIDILRRPFIAYWAMRYGADMKTPFASIQGPR